MHVDRNGENTGMDSPSIRTVDAYFVGLGRVLAEIFDVPEHVAATVLAHKVANTSANAHVGNGRLFQSPFLHGNALEENEAPAINDLFAESTQEMAQPGQGEAFLMDGSAAAR